MHSTPEDPSGFLESGFQEGQIRRIMEFVRLCFEEFVSRSGITDKVSDQLPDRVPLYCRPFGDNGNIYAGVHLVQQFEDFAKRIPSRMTGVDLFLDRDFLQSARHQTMTKKDLLYAFSAMSMNNYIGPWNHSHDLSFLHGIADKLDMPRENRFLLDPSHVIATTGLAVDNAIVADYSPAIEGGAHAICSSTFCDVPLAQMWKINERLIDVKERQNRTVTTGEIEETLRDVIPDQAEKILSSPAFRTASPGIHSILARSRGKTKLVVMRFEVSKKQHVDDSGETDSRLDTLKFDIPRKDMQKGIFRIIDGKRRTIGKAAQTVLHGYLIIDATAADPEARHHPNRKDVIGYEYSIPGVGTMEIASTMNQGVKKVR